MPYSTDFRNKIVTTYIETMASYRDLAADFRVSLSFIQRLMKRYKDTCTVNAKPSGGGQTPLLTKDGLDKLKKLIEENPDAILEELCEIFEKEYQIKVSISTMWRSIESLNITRKKSISSSKTGK